MPVRLERLVAMDEEIRKGRYPTVQRFCDMFEVQPRTVYEDIRMLKEQLGMEIVFDRFKNGYYNANPKKELPAFELTDGEVFALMLSKEMLSQYTGTAFEPILRSAIEKIQERLPNKCQVELDDIRSLVRFNSGPVITIPRKLFLDLNRACEHYVTVVIEYYSASKGEMTKRLVDPYRLMENRGTWYLIAFCHMRNDLRLFALHRIREHELTDAHFKEREDIDIDRWMDTAFMVEHRDQSHRIMVVFKPTAARYIRERVWHPSQDLVEHESGSCTLSFDTPSLEEVQRWLLSFGEDAKVLAPHELVKMMRESLTGALENYS
jgi:predicted DNA-binding transcriptional regulator YafY